MLCFNMIYCDLVSIKTNCDRPTSINISYSLIVLTDNNYNSNILKIDTLSGYYGSLSVTRRLHFLNFSFIFLSYSHYIHNLDPTCKF